MQWTEQFDLFLFDFDGLLVDTEQIHHKAYSLLCSEKGFPLSWSHDEYIQIAHTSADGLRKALVPHLRVEERIWPELYQRKKELYQSLVTSEPVPLMEGVSPLLGHLAKGGKKRCVVTNSTKQQVEAIIVAHPILQTIPVWITREQYKEPKPAPDGYLKAIEMLGKRGDRVIGFEDSLRGIQSLVEAGAFPVLICPPSHPQLLEVALERITHVHTFSSISRAL